MTLTLPSITFIALGIAFNSSFFGQLADQLAM
jgi:hypothetical protein